MVAAVASGSPKQILVWAFGADDVGQVERLLGGQQDREALGPAFADHGGDGLERGDPVGFVDDGDVADGVRHRRQVLYAQQQRGQDEAGGEDGGLAVAGDPRQPEDDVAVDHFAERLAGAEQVVAGQVADHPGQVVVELVVEGLAGSASGALRRRSGRRPRGPSRVCASAGRPCG